MRSCTWPSRIEVKDSGTYAITVEASQFLSPEGHSFTGPMKLEVYARPVSVTDHRKCRRFAFSTRSTWPAMPRRRRHLRPISTRETPCSSAERMRR